MATIKAGSGAIKVTSSGKLATTCGAVVCHVATGGTGGDGVGDGEFRELEFSTDIDPETRSFAEFPNFPAFIMIGIGVLDDICVISPSPVTGGNYAISASGGFVIPPYHGSINGGCCLDHAPFTFSISVGAATYTPPVENCKDIEDGGTGLQLHAFQAGLISAGIFVAGGRSYTEGGGYVGDACGAVPMNQIVSREQLQSLGFTGSKLKLYGGHLGCGCGGASITIQGCPYVYWSAHWNCISLEWDCYRATGITSIPPTDWATVDGISFWRITNSLTPPGYPPPYTCRRRARAIYNCFETDPENQWRIEWVDDAGPALPLFGWSPYQNGNPEYGYNGNGVFECVVEAININNGESFGWELPEDPPSSTPNCYCEWSAYYDCYSQSWQIYPGECYATHEPASNVNQWVGTGGYRTMVSTSNTEPSPPGDTPTCVTFWEAYWNGTSWDKYGFYTDIGEESDPPWTCYGTEYASGAFAVGVTPDDPVCEE